MNLREIVYAYIYIHRERKRDIDMYVYIYIRIYRYARTMMLRNARTCSTKDWILASPTASDMCKRTCTEVEEIHEPL